MWVKLIKVGENNSGFYSEKVLRESGVKAFSPGTLVIWGTSPDALFWHRRLAGAVKETELREDGLYVRVSLTDRAKEAQKIVGDKMKFGFTSYVWGDEVTENNRLVVEGFVDSAYNRVNLEIVPNSGRCDTL